MKRKSLIWATAAVAMICSGVAYAGPNDPHPYPVTASKNSPKHVSHIVNANNRAPIYPATAKTERMQKVSHNHHLKHHRA